MWLATFTFHSGYILIILASSIIWYTGNFTFHSGYILIKFLPWIRITRDLYIPFWLYSNTISSPIYFFISALYIPFWLYSNVLKRYVVTRGDTLYIPVWLYSNVTAEHKVNVKNGNFTFHSGYILIRGVLSAIWYDKLYIPFWLYSNWRCGEIN